MAFMENIHTSEKRKSRRADIDLPVKYSKTNLFFKQGRATNASEGGLMICLPEKMDIGHHLVLKLFFPFHSGLNVIEAVVRVVWMDVHLKKDWSWDYRMGVRFEDISQTNMTTLKNFLTNLEQKPSYAS
ncbi:MAG TPA: PilZ domain-containing protein [Saprospiraceae bacterium]|nr:PilZ domain-containing protein [Saprospiraceae bacterium]